MALSVEEREEFLCQPHIGALSVDSGEPGRAPLTVPIWYGYEPGGDLWITTERASRKARLIEAAGRFSLMVDRVEPTVRYVSVEGEVVSVEPTTAAEGREITERYLPADRVEEYLRFSKENHHDVITIRLRPRRWISQDLGAA